MNHHPCSVHLRAMEPEDLDILYQIENNSSLWDAGTTNVPYSRFAIHEYMSTATSDIYTDKQLRLMVEDTHRQVVGIVDLTNFDPRHLRAEVGIVICKDWRRKGYGAAAVSQLLSYAEGVLHLRQLYAVVAEHNSPALSLFDKMGFHQAGVLSQWLCCQDGLYRSAVIMQHFFRKSCD